MLKKRIIARIDIKNNFLIKGIGREGVKKIANPIEAIKSYFKDGIDEISIIDVTASLYTNKLLNKNFQTITQNLFVPIVIGGGIRNLKQAKLAFKNGADKIILNTNAFKNTKFLRELVNNFGSSNVAVNIDSIFNGSNYEVLIENGKQKTGKNLIKLIKELNEIKVGEITVCKLSHEGRMKGLDLKLYQLISNYTDITIIAHGGTGNINDLVELFKKTNVDGASLASLLHYNYLDLKKFNLIDDPNIYLPENYEKNVSIKKLKEKLKKNKINVR